MVKYDKAVKCSLDLLIRKSLKKKKRKKVTNLGKNSFKWWDGKNGEMEVANADNNFRKFRSEGVKWLREKETRLEEAFLTCLVCF